MSSEVIVWHIHLYGADLQTDCCVDIFCLSCPTWGLPRSESLWRVEDGIYVDLERFSRERGAESSPHGLSLICPPPRPLPVGEGE
jgi:hypothetical protein